MTSTHRPRPAALVAALLALALALTACGSTVARDDAAESGGAVATDDSGSEGAADGAALDEATAATGESAAGGGTGLAEVDPAVVAENRQIVSTGRIAVTVDDLDRAVERLLTLVEDADGLVFDERTDLQAGARTRLVVKVPPEAFRPTLDALGRLGEVATQSVSTEDVTAQVVDLESRIATAEASVLRLRALLADAGAVRDIALIEGELLRRETDLETLRGQLRTVEGQVALATITVILSAERTSPPPPPERPQAGFVDGLRGGADALRTMAVGLSAVAGALLPWLPFLLAAAWLAHRWHRRTRTTPASNP